MGIVEIRKKYNAQRAAVQAQYEQRRDREIGEYDKARNCTHEGTEVIARRTLSNGTVHFGYQCTSCGKWTAAKKDEILRANDGQEPTTEYDPTIRADRFGESRGEIQNAWEWKKRRFALIRKDEKEEFDRWYNGYLRSMEWASIRDRVLRRDGGKCQGCLQRSASIVHHKTYVRVGHEMMFDLVALCRRCHDRAHPEHHGAPDWDTLLPEPRDWDRMR